MRKSLLLIIVTLIIFGITCAQYNQINQPQPLTVIEPDTLQVIDTLPKVDTLQIDSVVELSFKDSLYLAMEEYDIHHQDIVYAQAILETGHFKSKLCKKGNLFGLKKGKKEYYHFNHWKESVKMYKDKIQRRYKEGEDYYHFLKRIHYASGESYNKKVKQIVKQIKNKKNGKTKQNRDRSSS